MKANLPGRWMVKKESAGRFNDVPAQFIPGIALSEDVLRKALCAIPAIRVLGCLKNQVVHIGLWVAL